MSNRTNLLIAALILVSFHVCASATAEPPDSNQPSMSVEDVNNAADAISKNTRVAALERKQLQALADNNPNVFSFQLHNRLRHLYFVGKDPTESSRQTEIILRNIFLDPYTMNVLSGWKLEKDPKAAIANYEKSLKNSHKDFPVTQAACLIMLGDLYLAEDKNDKAQAYYQEVLKLQGEGVGEYHTVAKTRLEGF
jgi:hypothetical protein